MKHCGTVGVGSKGNGVENDELSGVRYDCSPRSRMIQIFIYKN